MRLFISLLSFIACLPIQSHALEWMTDYKGAQERARTEQKILFVNFTGSDWCGWCMRLKKQVFDTAPFEQYVKENAILVEIDFPHKKSLPENLQRQNEALARQHN